MLTRHVAFDVLLGSVAKKMHTDDMMLCHISSEKEIYLYDICIIYPLLPLFYLANVTGVVILQGIAKKTSPTNVAS